MNKKILLFLKLIVFSIFISRAYQHLFWDFPYRTVFWCEPYFRDIVETVFNTPWENYVSVEVDLIFRKIIKFIGVIFLLSSFIVLKLNKENYKYFKFILLPVFFWQFFMTYCITKESFFHIGMFLEHSIQIGAPFILVLSIHQFNLDKIKMYSKLIIGLTFFCHGLYAFGYYNVPGGFIDMTLIILKISESNAILFLKMIGIIDFLILPLLFIKKTTKATLFYCIVWGLLTAFARVVANWHPVFIIEILHQYTFETTVRLCHGLFPLFTYFLLKHEKSQ